MSTTTRGRLPDVSSQPWRLVISAQPTVAELAQACRDLAAHQSVQLEVHGCSDLRTVDAVARLQLHARRVGVLVVVLADPRLRELLELAGVRPGE